MKCEEVTLRVCKFADKLIDMYFPQTDFINKIKNSTCKFWMEQNTYRVKNVIKMFSDETGDIDIDVLMNYYDNIFMENHQLKLDVKSLIPDEYQYVKPYLPDKVILLNMDDFMNVFY